MDVTLSDRPRGERAALDLLARLLPPPPVGQTWIGDDAAVLAPTGGAELLLATDCVVSGVHFDLERSSLEDVGWKALSVNVSDLAAMGGRPLAAVVAVAGASAAELEVLYVGLLEASARYGCPVVGGDLSSGPALVVSIAVLGVPVGAAPVLRSGASVGDVLFVTGPLGRSAAGMRLLNEVPDRDPGNEDDLVSAHRRPVARLREAAAAVAGGATAMIDLSDGLGLDLDRLASASRVGVELDGVPIARGATLEEALGGGEDYELCFAAPDGAALLEAFAARGLTGPVPIGRCVEDPSRRRLAGAPLRATGFAHRLKGEPGSTW